MKHISKLWSLILITTFSIIIQVTACPVRIENDGYENRKTIIITDTGREHHTMFILRPHKSHVVGSKDHRPIITIYTKDRHSGSFSASFEVKMIACCADKSKEAQLNIGDIMNNTYDKELFLATPSANTHKTMMKTAPDESIDT